MRLYESIKYPFTESEIRELGEALARENQSVYDLREQRKEVATNLGALVKAAEKRAADLTLKINNGYELRDIECMYILETPRPGMKRLIRLDITDPEKQIVRDEPMTAAEMQSSFGFQAGDDPRQEK